MDLGYSKEDCIDRLKEIIENNEGKIPSRDSFRILSDIPQSVWLGYFGTWTEFKVQAGIVDSKHTKHVLEKVRNHSAFESWGEANREKYGWKDSYKKPSNTRHQTFIVCSDVHDEMCDPFYRRMFLHAALIYKPQQVIINGDLYDQPEIAKYANRPLENRPEQRNKWVWSFLRDLRNIVPDAEFNMIEGNHEYRLITYLTEKAPYIMDVLSLHGMSAVEFLGLNEFEVNYHSRADFGLYNDAHIQMATKRNYYAFKDIIMFHHFPEGKTFGMPGISGHHHKFKVTPMFNTTYGSYSWYETGAGSRRHVDYQIRMGEQWNNGFMIVHVDSHNKKNTIFEYVDCTNSNAVIGGTKFSRTLAESKFLT